MVKPNFFIIGAPKCGTTSLAAYLNMHPNVYFCPMKEPNYFDFDLSRDTKISLKEYLNLFSNADPDKHKAIGEGSTNYLFSNCAVKEILKFNPDAKFIVMLRNPVDMVYSLHSEMLFEGAEDIKDFDKAWNEIERRSAGKNIPLSCFEPKRLIYSEWAKFGEQMERLLAIVPRSKIKVIIFDDFAKDIKKTYEEVLAFLDVPSDHREDFKVINENKVVRSHFLQKRLTIIANVFRWLHIHWGINFRLGPLYAKLFFLNSNYSPRKPLQTELREELCNYYRPDVEKLSRLLGRDLSHWVNRTSANEG